MVFSRGWYGVKSQYRSKPKAAMALSRRHEKARSRETAGFGNLVIGAIDK
jgi:hypothetical protein